MLKERVEQWTEEWKAQGKEELMRQLAARKFGPVAADRLEEWLVRMRGSRRATEAGLWLLECESADELLNRMEGASAPPPEEAGVPAP